MHKNGRMATAPIELVTPVEAAAILGCSVWTVYRMTGTDTPKLTEYARVGGRRVFLRSEVEALAHPQAVAS